MPIKIRTCAALLIALLALSLLAGCAARAAETLDAAGDAVEHKLDTIEEAAEAAVIHAITLEPAAPQPAPAETVPVETAAPAVTEAAKAQLTKEEAQAIALQHAGFTAGQVQRLWAEYEIDDRVPQYDVEFHEGRWEYEYEIHAETGAILSFEKDD